MFDVGLIGLQLRVTENLPSLSAQNNQWELCVSSASQKLRLVRPNAVEGDVWFPDIGPAPVRVQTEVFSTVREKIGQNSQLVTLICLLIYYTYIVQSLVV